MRGCCEAVGCRAGILPTELFCQRHVVMVETDTRRILERTFGPGRRASAVLEKALETARAEILFVQTNGYRMPREQVFEC